MRCAVVQQVAHCYIVAAIRRVSIYDLEKMTALRTDFSNVGIGYFLFQKHCECDGDRLNCCKDGWRISFSMSKTSICW